MDTLCTFLFNPKGRARWEGGASPHRRCGNESLKQTGPIDPQTRFLCSGFREPSSYFTLLGRHCGQVQVKETKLSSLRPSCALDRLSPRPHLRSCLLTNPWFWLGKLKKQKECPYRLLEDILNRASVPLLQRRLHGSACS